MVKIQIFTECTFSTGTNNEAQEVSLHPPHLVDSNGSLTPAALIPFCAYQTNMTLLGQTRQGLPFTACSQFKPTVLEGQLCYSLDLSSVPKDGSKHGVESGLMMIIDSSSNFDLDIESSGNSLSIKTKPFGDDSRIYLNTLASFTDHRPGSYAISAVKKMEGTDTFLDLPIENRNCQLQTLENCQVQQYVKEVKKECGCVPWALSKVLTLKVGFAPIDPFTILFQAPKFCSPNSSACYTAISTKPHNCKVSCTGLYADVLFADNAPVEMTERDLMMRKIDTLTRAGISYTK